jgi:hypothetical protein
MQTRQTKNYAVLEIIIQEWRDKKYDEDGKFISSKYNLNYPTRVIADKLNRQECIDKIRENFRNEDYKTFYIMAIECDLGYTLGDPIASGEKFDFWVYQGNKCGGRPFAYDPPTYEPPCWLYERTRKRWKQNALEKWIDFENRTGKKWDYDFKEDWGKREAILFKDDSKNRDKHFTAERRVVNHPKIAM